MISHPYEGDPTEKQLKVRGRFAAIASAVSQWVKTEHEKRADRVLPPITEYSQSSATSMSTDPCEDILPRSM